MLLKMSLSGGILILLIALVRMAALNKLPKRMFMLLWSVALLRLLVPAELPLAWGIALPVVRAAEDIAGKMPVGERIMGETPVERTKKIQGLSPEALQKALPIRQQKRIRIGKPAAFRIPGRTIHFTSGWPERLQCSLS